MSDILEFLLLKKTTFSISFVLRTVLILNVNINEIYMILKMKSKMFKNERYYLHLLQLLKQFIQFYHGHSLKALVHFAK